MKWFKSAALLLLSFGLFYVIFAYAGGFPERQSLVIASIVAILARKIGTAAGKPTMRFTPYYIQVQPKWCELLSDLKVINAPEEWYSIENVELQRGTLYRVLRDGARFSIIQQSEDAERILIYSNDHSVFVSQVDFTEDLEPIQVQGQRENERTRTARIQFFVKSGIEGYDLGIHVPEWWWESRKATCTAPLKEKNEYGIGMVKLILATISYREFDLYWEPVQWSSAFANKTAREIRARRDDQRHKLGWVAIELEHPPELALQWPECLKHRYFTVEHNSI